MYTFSKQLWGLHSPSTCSVQNFQIFMGDNFCHTYTLHTFLDSLCIQLLSKHMLRSKFSNFHERSFFHAYTLHTCFRIHSTYSYLVYTLHTVIWFTLSKHLLGSKFSNFLRRSFFYAYTLHTCFRVHSPYSYLIYTHQAHVRFNVFGFSQKFIFFILTPSTHVSEYTLRAVVFTLSKQMLHFKILYSYYNFIMCLNAPLIMNV